MNFEGQPPDSKLDEMYIKLIRQANLDAIGGRAVTTTQAHAAAVKRIVRNCAAIRKTPTIPARGPTPFGDAVGMSIVVDMLQNLLLATSRKFRRTRQSGLLVSPPVNAHPPVDRGGLNALNFYPTLTLTHERLPFWPLVFHFW
jgi:hypothetical protein